MLIPATHFFDDFSHVEPAAFSDSNVEDVQWLLDLIGWEYKSDPEYLLPPAARFSPLGVQIDFSHPGWDEVANTTKRKDNMLNDIEDLTALDRIPAHDVESLVGVC